MTERTKTSLMISKRLTPEIQKLSGLLGVSKSDFTSMALAFLVVRLAQLERTTQKRKQLILTVKSEFQKIVDEALAKA